MKYLIVLFALIAAAFAVPQFYGQHHPVGYGGVPPPQFGASAANAQASSQSFNTGGYPGFGGGLSGSSANAAAGSQTFNQGYGR